MEGAKEREMTMMEERWWQSHLPNVRPHWTAPSKLNQLIIDQ